MNDFDWDAKQKKNIARSARHMASKRGKRGCTLPSDNLTEAQRRKLNGECRTYTLREPLTYEQFKDLPDDLKREYLLWLQETFGVTDQKIGEMMGVSKTPILTVRKELGISASYAQKGARMPKERVTAWEDWLRAYDPEFETEPEGGEQPIICAEEDIAPVTVEEPTPEPEPKRTPSRIETCRFTASGAAGATAELLLGLFKGDPRKAHFTVEVSFDA